MPCRARLAAPDPSVVSPEPAVEVAPLVHGVSPDSLDPDDPDARLYTSAPIDTDDGSVVIQQQNVGPDNEEGGGEWPNPETPPQRPAPGAD